ncbi:Mfa1 family fimbria major subunit [Bacteroides reticulotermitis]|uniref:Mfa1 family fimbria major subunit n=1 Tax=Bacteroides reticulotermitis TaxID=1133319 RepID=UPI003A89FAEA
MKKYFKTVFLATAVMVSFASCSNDEIVDNGNDIPEGEKTSFILTIDQPQTYAASDDNATDREKLINDVDVFIFDKNDQLRSHTALTTNDFSETNSQLTSTKKIPTTTGFKRVYVGVNLNKDLVANIKTMGVGATHQLLEKVLDNKVTELGNELDNNGYAMFSKVVQEPTFTLDEKNNVVKVNVERLVAKVVVYEKDGLKKQLESGDISTIEFAVGNVNTKFFPLPKANYMDPNYIETTTDLADFLKLGYSDSYYIAANTEGTTIVKANKWNILENTSKGKRKSQLTYTSIRAKFLPKYFVRWNSTTKKLENDTRPGGADTFHQVKSDKGIYYFTDAGQATAYGNSCTPKVTPVTFERGWCYYPVYLNPTGTHNGVSKAEDKFNVYRNNIYKVVIASIAGPGISKITDPTDPTEPVDETTNMTVEVTIEPWTLNTQTEDLPSN